MRFHLVLWFLFLANYGLAQFDYELPCIPDSEFTFFDNNNGTIRLEGNLHELVIVVGFPDQIYSFPYPSFENSEIYPVMGVDEEGVLLRDKITANNGSLEIDQWYEPAFEKYFESLSGGIYDVDFDFVKNEAGGRYLTTTGIPKGRLVSVI